jgi:DNA repair protein RecN (Recombination protein N)
MPEELPAVYQAMEEQRLLDDSAGSLESLSQQVVEHHQLALETARQLHALRQASADELTQLITESMHSLSMPHGSSRLRSLSMNAISPPTAPIILSSASPLTPVSRCSRSSQSLRRRSCRVLRWRFR